jgi:hypothetical protein
MTTHLPDDFNSNYTAGSACGMTFGQGSWDYRRDTVVLDEWEAGLVDCIDCVELIGTMGFVIQEVPW